MKALAVVLLALSLVACGGGGGGGGQAAPPPPTATTPPVEPTALELRAAAKLLDMGTFVQRLQTSMLQQDKHLRVG